MKNTDLVIGPLYSNENEMVQQFSVNNQVNVVNPFSNNSDLIGDNPYAYLFQSSSETLGKKAAEYIAKNARKNLAIVISSKKDSVLAANFTQKASELGLNIAANKALEKEDAGFG